MSVRIETSRRKGVGHARSDESLDHRVKTGGAQSGEARPAMPSAASGSAGAKKPAGQPVRKTVGKHKGNIGMAGTIEKSFLAVALFGIVLPHAGWAPSRGRYCENDSVATFVSPRSISVVHWGHLVYAG